MLLQETRMGVGLRLPYLVRRKEGALMLIKFNITLITKEMNRFFYRASYATTVSAVTVCLSVSLFVRHKSELYKDG